MSHERKVLYASFILFGTIVGAGIFALPYVVFHSGLLISLFFFLIISLFSLFFHLMYGEVALRTPGTHRLPGYVRIYLGALWSEIVTAIELVSGYGGMIVYMILGGQFLTLLFGGDVFSGNALYFTFLFWAVLSICVAFGLRSVGKIELWFNVILIAVLIFLMMIGVRYFSFDSFSFASDKVVSPLLAYGALIFALSGAIAIPEMRDLLRGNEKKLRLSIISGTLLAILVSFIFAFGVAAITKGLTSENSLDGLKIVLGDGAVVLGALVGLIAVATSYLIVGLYVRDVFKFDFGVPSVASTALSIGMPLTLFVMGLQSFLGLIGFLGSVTGAFSIIITLFLFNKAKKMGTRVPEYHLSMPKWFVGILMLVFFLGALAELYTIL